MKKIKRRLKNYIRDIIKIFLSPERYIKSRFYLIHGYRINLKNPKTWSEKIQKRKLYGNHELYSNYVDKFLVREKIREILGEEYLIPLLGKYSKITPKDIESLPQSFVIKTSNGGGGENVKIVTDKDKINKIEICKEFNNFLKIKIGKKIDELFYDYNQPVIVIEKLMLDENGDIPSDYKFHCFKNGEKLKIITQVDYDRYKNHGQNFYDEEWNLLDLEVFSPIRNRLYKKPKNFEKMKEVAKKLSKDFSYVRVDLYTVEEKIYFGEMTFCPWSGFQKFKPQNWDKIWGDYWGEFVSEENK